MNTAFKTANNGTVVANHVTGWKSTTLANSVVLLRLEFASSPEQLQAVLTATEPASFEQLMLTPQQAIELAKRLTFLAGIIMRQSTPPKPLQN